MIATSAQTFTINQASILDLNGLRHLEKACFPQDAWPLLDLIAVLSFPGVVRLKAVVDHDMVGFIAGDPRPGENLAWIATVGVLPEYQQQGIGRALIEACEAQLEIPRVRLTVRINNSNAIRLYEKLGYRNMDVMRHYYNDGGDALVMEKYR
jgi:ribosomal-protein-alanine N-acetyltransferase